MIALGMLGLTSMIACSPLEPLDEPEVSGLQLTADTLKTSLRDAQRTIAELRAEVESRRQELADVQIARAQLEGRLREAERRLVEARHVVDLQREELAGSRSERERVAKSGVLLRNQLKQLQLQLSRLGKPASDSRSAGAAAPALQLREGPPVGGVPGSKPVVNGPARVSVRAGDTLWSLAQRHRIPLKRLMALNRLSDSRIQVGQALWLIAPPAAGEGEQPE
jgi:LysM repeat protein